MGFLYERHHWLRQNFSFSSSERRVVFDEGLPFGVADTKVESTPYIPDDTPSASALADAVNVTRTSSDALSALSHVVPEDKHAFGGIGSHGVNMTEDFQELADANIPSPLLKEHKDGYTNILLQIARSVPSSNTTMGRAEFFSGLQKADLENNLAVQEWYASENPNDSEKGHDAFLRANKNTEKKIQILDDQINQLYSGYSTSTQSKSLKNHGYDEFTGTKEEAILKLQLQQETLYDPLKFNRLNSEKKDALDRYVKYLEFFIEREILRAQSRTLATRPVTNISAFKTSIDSIKANLKDQVEKKKVEQAKFPNRSSNQVQIAKIQVDIDILQKELDFYEEYEDSYDRQSPPNQVRDALGIKDKYENETDKKQYEQKSAKVLGETYLFVQKTLFQTPGLPNDRLSDEVKNGLINICMTGGVSPTTLKRGLQKMNTQTADIHGLVAGIPEGYISLQAFYEGLESLAQGQITGKDDLKKTNLYMQSIFGAGQWEKISDHLLGSTMQKVSADLAAEHVAHETKNNLFRKQYGVSLPTLYDSWQKYKNGAGKDYGAELEVGKWFELTSTGTKKIGTASSMKNEDAMKDLLMNILPEKSDPDKEGTKGDYSVEDFEKDFEENKGWSTKYLSFLREINGKFNEENKYKETQINTAENIKKTMESWDADQVGDFLGDQVDALTSGDIGSMAPRIIGLFLLWRAWGTSLGKKGIQAALGLYAVDRIAMDQTGKSYLSKAWGYAMGDNQLEAENLPNSITSRNAEDLRKQDISENEATRAGNAMGEVPAKHMIDWYKKAKGTWESEPNCPDPFCAVDLPDKIKSANIIEGSGTTQMNRDNANEKARIAYFFLENFFANIAEDNELNNVYRVDARNKDKKTLAANGLEFIENEYVNNDNLSAVEASERAESPVLMQEIFTREISSEQKQYALQKNSPGWKDLQSLYADVSMETIAAFERWGIKNPLEYAKDLGEWVKTTGHTIKKITATEFETQDRMGHIWTLTKDKADGMWKWGTNKAFGKEIGFFDTFKEAMEEIQRHGVEAQQRWVAIWQGIPFDDLQKEETIPEKNIPDINTKGELVTTIENMGITESLMSLYGFDRKQDLDSVLNLSQAQISKELTKLADIRFERSENLSAYAPTIQDPDFPTDPTKTIPNPNADATKVEPKGITQGDIITYFYGKAYGLGKSIQVVQDTVRDGLRGAASVQSSIPSFYNHISKNGLLQFLPNLENIGVSGDKILAYENFVQKYTPGRTFDVEKFVGGNLSFEKIARNKVSTNTVVNAPPSSVPAASLKPSIWSEDKLLSFIDYNLSQKLKVSNLQILKPGLKNLDPTEVIKKIENKIKGKFLNKSARSELLQRAIDLEKAASVHSNFKGPSTQYIYAALFAPSKSAEVYVFLADFNYYLK